MERIEQAFSGDSLAFVEELYEAYLADPGQVDESWRRLFGGVPGSPRSRPARSGYRAPSIFAAPAGGGDGGPAAPVADADAGLQDRVDQLVQAYRVSGHLAARLDPLERPRPPCAELDPAHHGITAADLDRTCSTRSVGGADDRTVRALVERLRTTYCRTIGVQYAHIEDAAARGWLQERMEATGNHIKLDYHQRVRLYTKLADAEIFEQFLHRKFVGAKRFSLEGGESLIPLLDLAVERAAARGVQEIVIGMAHRGRLNVLANILRKSPQQIFREFEDMDADRYWCRGDVKYHLGHTTVRRTLGGNGVRLTLCCNPSHLEFVGPVVLGRVRSRQDRCRDVERSRVMPVVIHGDAAFSGQGVVQEMLNMSQLPGYATGGTLHVVVNNQIGFTTPPESSRSCRYATDVARMLEGPIFHVNGEDPEAVAQVVELAIDYRMRFHGDVIVDMYCYRRHGHNEGDEPAFTQPKMYEHIRARRSVREAYLDHLVRPDGFSRQLAEGIAKERHEVLDHELTRAREGAELPTTETLEELWKPFRGGPDRDTPDVPTAAPRDELAALLLQLTTVPEGFQPHRKVERFLELRAEMARGQRPLDWAAGEALAFATLLRAGHRVRLSGQDSGRGTFSHRHAVLRDVRDERVHVALQHLAPDQGSFEVWDSPLSEVAVLGFDYGYSLDRPDGLVLWEAQFGDFCNVAQVVIDQFISSAEDKWDLLSGLVLLLPHGFEGQGPEHSSARLERFLQLCAEDNIQVVNLTTPAQLFHCLRRQALRPWRKPLVVMAPKGLLRHPQAVSSLDELATGSFRCVLPDERPAEPVRRVVLTSGRLYYDLAQARADRGLEQVAIVRLEQLYPLREAELAAAIDRYAPDVELVWAQEEPRNMGAWYYLHARLSGTPWGPRLRCVSRDESASPATGSPTSHKAEQDLLIRQALGVA